MEYKKMQKGLDQTCRIPIRRLVIFMAALMASSISVQADERPNIVMIVADDLGRQDCGFMGGIEIKTPHLDHLARAGAILDAHYVLPVCSPTRAALMTGRYPMRHGLQVGVVRPWAQYGLPLAEQLLSQALKQSGYKTAIVGKWHLGHFEPEYLPTRRGFDHQYGHYNGAIDYFDHTRDGGFDWHSDDKASHDIGYSTTLIADYAARFVAENASKSPFFLYVPFNAVHAPHQVPESYMKPYSHLKGERRNYAGMLAAMDEAVGRIVKSVESAGIRHKTLFLFTSDNGGPSPGKITDNGRFRAGKGTLYEGGVRVAAFATWDNHINAGITIREPIHAVDWYPTLTKLAGATPNQNLPLDGMDIWPVIVAGARSPHDAILLNSTPNQGAIRAGDWKLVVKNGDENPDGDEPAKSKQAKPKKAAVRSVELFDLNADPYESINLATDRPEKVLELKTRLDQFARQAIRPKARPKPNGFQAPQVWGESNAKAIKK